MHTYEEFYEIDCDELEFPNLLTINSLPNEILAIIKDYKIKLELNDYFDDAVILKKSSITYKHKSNIDYFINKVQTKNFNIKQAHKYNFQCELYVMYYNLYYGGYVESWDKLDKVVFNNIKHQRREILEYFKNFNYDEIIEFCEEFEDYSLKYTGKMEVNFNAVLSKYDVEEWKKFDKKSIAKLFYNLFEYSDYADYKPYMEAITGIKKDAEW